MTFESIGPYGLAGGQFIDIDKDTVLNNTEQYIDLMQKKTAVLFELAFCVGWIIAGGAYSKLHLVQEIGKNIGIAFQIADDISDVNTDAITAEGKPNLNFACKYTMSVALIEYNKFKSGAILLMKQIGLYTPLWEKELFPLIDPKPQ
jgi:geranylgeranyl pyrophosphate synthase